MRYHKVCKECVLSGDCLFQDNNDVETCEDVMAAEIDDSRKMGGDGENM